MSDPFRRDPEGSASADAASLRRLATTLLITVAVAMAVGRILSAILVFEPDIHRRPGNPGDLRRPWPAERPAPMPTYSSNDRSRWAAVRALVDDGTWVVGRRNRQVVLASAPAALAAPDPLQLAVLLDAGYESRVRSDTGIITQEGWKTVDKVLNPTTLDYYSTKPPLLTVLAAGEYAVLKKAFGWRIWRDDGNDERFLVIRTIVLTFNVLPLIVYLVLLARAAALFGGTDWGRLYVLAAACFGTLVSPFLVTFNNHTVATCSAMVALYAAVRIGSRPAADPGSWRAYIVAGFFAGFTAASELPALAFAVGLGALLLLRSPRRAVLAYGLAAAVPLAALAGTNYLELGQLRPAYSEVGGPWYQYEGSHWRAPPGQVKRGIDFARYRETRATYAFHLLLGHHGLLSLMPIWFLALAGMVVGVQRLRRGGRPPGSALDSETVPGGWPWPLLAVATLVLTVVVVGFYLMNDSRNYGGWTAGPRWLMWLTPFWLLTMLPAADWLGRRRWGRLLALVLLGLSVLSMSYPAWNPWRHPWIYNLMDAWGGIPY